MSDPWKGLGGSLAAIIRDLAAACVPLGHHLEQVLIALIQLEAQLIIAGAADFEAWEDERCRV